ncbi:desulfoferrodoxin [Moorella sp. E308F]|uniref:desulfoferrodoxin n=1 Tax=unclassified Neomoorella TaxID=2676739 RepID=UPI0010FFAD68|nr:MULTISPECIES: desulfoferrodoxin [unclassified Moorella (in: firmicutes)]GEA15719.1 desulfoferrodoxin [Moorella sp. E308F]GEA19437.1 desulfoferrodoxin [Moorella sp. E306M]
MTAIGQVYRCNVCGNIVEVLHPGVGALVCCGKPMELLTENTVDASKEKHVPVVTKVNGGFKVTVGSIPHPMEEKHYIEWIELQAGGQVLRQHLDPGDAPEAVFCTESGSATARAYCNLHGHWRSNN